MPSVNVLSGYLVIYVSLNFVVAPVSTFSSLACEGHQGLMICIILFGDWTHSPFIYYFHC